MKAGSRKMRSMKRRLMNKYRSMSRKVSRKFAGGKKSSRAFAGAKRQRGGYAQYQNNLPMTPVYKVAGVELPYNQLGLANPPPVTVLSNSGQCTDNYNHFLGRGFPSRGH